MMVKDPLIGGTLIPTNPALQKEPESFLEWPLALLGMSVPHLRKVG